MEIKPLQTLLNATRDARDLAIRSWSRACAAFFEAVTAAYPHLVETNLRRDGEATLDLLASGATADPSLQSAQYPPLRSKLEEPVLRALSEVGALHIDPAGDMAVEPGPAALLRGLARLALPARNLLGIVNAARKWRGQAPLSDSEFDALDSEVFQALKNGLQRALGEEWFRMLNHASSLASRALVLPCTPLRGSQEFYEEGILFYSAQKSAAALYVYSTTSGLVIPREFHGDTAKNPYRLQYFTEGILGPTPTHRIYQWERYRTAKNLAKGYAAAPDASAQALYRQQAIETLGRFAGAPHLEIRETDRFDLWKEWHTLVGPRRQQISIRPADLQGKIGHGILYDLDAFKTRGDILREAGSAIIAAQQLAGLAGASDWHQFGPACLTAAAACILLGCGLSRLAPLIHQPLLKKCEQDRANGENVRTIKPLNTTLPAQEVEAAVDQLLEAGRRILALENQPPTASE